LRPWFCAKYDTPRLLRSPPSQEGNYRDQTSLISFFGESPLERGASSVVKMEEAGCVKIRIADGFTRYLQNSCNQDIIAYQIIE
jgi:hypothetical protein